MEHVIDWQRVLERPAAGDHMVQIYQDRAMLADAVADYIGPGVEGGEAAVLIARPEHCEAILDALCRRDRKAHSAIRDGQITLLDAKDTLEKFMVDGRPLWTKFREQIGGVIERALVRYPAVRLYGEMVDILWQAQEREAAITLEGFWNELRKSYRFSLFCAYRMDPVDNMIYATGGLGSICDVHTHLIPMREVDKFNRAVDEATNEVLEPRLAGMCLSISAAERSGTKMSQGHATLLWLQRNMPRTADKILAGVRRRWIAHPT